MYTPSLTQLAPRQYKKILRQNPLKTSEISKLLKSKKTFKRKSPFSFEDSLSKQQVTTRKMVEPDGIEPTTSCVQGRRSPS
jgi:hypothetical protein